MVGLFQTRERRALVVFLLLAGVFVAGLLLAERRKSAVSADRVEAEMEATVAADSVRLFEFDPNTSFLAFAMSVMEARIRKCFACCMSRLPKYNSANRYSTLALSGFVSVQCS